MDLQTLGIFAGLLTAWGAILLLAVRFLLRQFSDQINARFEVLASERRRESTRVGELEREVLELKAALPVEYVRREDAIRNETAFHAKLDALAAELRELRKELKA